MSFKKFETRSELIDIIYSVEDTALIDGIDYQVAFENIMNMGFLPVGSIMNLNIGSGQSFRFEDNDAIIYFCFSKPSNPGGKLYMTEKHFFKQLTHHTVFHRLNAPCSISYHSNGSVFKSKYRFEGDTYASLFVDGLEYSHLETIINVKSTKEYHFRAQPWHVKRVKVNLNSMSIMQASYCIFNIDNIGANPSYMEHHQVKKFYPDIGKLNWYQKINLGKSLAADELTLIEMLMY